MTAKSYVMAVNPPPPTSWADYSAHVATAWEALLADTACTEKRVQEFIEQHPSLLPCPIGRPLDQGDSNPLSSAVQSQPELPGLRCKIPDFMYFTGDSGEITAVLVEIESPEKKWFTSSGQQTAEFTQAANQLVEWKAWFGDPANIPGFERDYLVRDYLALNSRQFRQHYVLVIGRRADNASHTLANRRSFHQRPGETWMTYDRLKPDPNFEDAVTIKLDRSELDTRFRVMHVPATLRIGPQHYINYRKLVGLEDAINANPSISPERKAFLLERIPYWKAWHESIHGAFMMDGPGMMGE